MTERKQNPGPPGRPQRVWSELSTTLHLRSTKNPRSGGSWPQARWRHQSCWVRQGGLRLAPPNAEVEGWAAGAVVPMAAGSTAGTYFLVFKNFL